MSQWLIKTEEEPEREYGYGRRYQEYNDLFSGAGAIHVFNDDVRENQKALGCDGYSFITDALRLARRNFRPRRSESLYVNARSINGGDLEKG